MHVAAPATAGANADQVDRAMADVVVAVAAEIFGREFPIARDQPFLDAAEYFAAAFAAVPGVKAQIEIADEITEIFEKGRRRRVPARPYRALIEGQLRNFDQPPT